MKLSMIKDDTIKDPRDKNMKNNTAFNKRQFLGNTIKF